VELFGIGNRLPHPDMVDIFYTMIVYCTMICCLGNNLYRPDFLGEDLNCLHVHQRQYTFFLLNLANSPQGSFPSISLFSFQGNIFLFLLDSTINP